MSYLENSIASQGKTIDEAIENLKEAIELYYEDETKDELNLPYKEQFYITTLEMAIYMDEKYPLLRPNEIISTL